MWTTKQMPDQSGKTAIVTGANIGIGYETAKALYEAGAQVIMACRNTEKAEEARHSLMQGGGAGKLEVAELKLEDLNSVQAFAENFISKYPALDILINNAGVMIPPLSKSSAGFELQFGVNFIGHFALTGHLYPLLKATGNSRVVTLSSMAYLNGKIDFDNLKAEKGYDAMREYRQSKLADIMFALELQRRIEIAGDPVASIAAQPGANRTGLSRYMTEEAFDETVARLGKLMEPWQGALPALYAATMPDAEAGVLYSPDEPSGYFGYPAVATLAAHALDKEVASRLFDLAASVTGLHFPY